MIKHINNLLENNNVLMGNIVRCFKDGSFSLCTWLSTLEGFPGSSVQSFFMSNFLQPHESHSMPGLPVRHQLPESTQTHVHPVDDAIQPSHPLSSPSPPWESSW